ncbi:MAG TPA: NAD(P)-dependent oxidoreductase [Elusimicrobia bacterium]|nr:MAG: hypothetical protein A2X37_05545 [Elusimicrobia bacterium GWA2_66_18]HAZ07482.1 NAD(P)-dependent oxidoreductase [Elusimicrobiota bacterium]
MILVAGATGKVGRELVMELKIRRAAFKVLVRDPAKANALLGPVDCAHGDFNAPHALDKLLAGVEAAFLLTPADPRMGAWQTAFARAAKKAGVKRLVKVSVLGAAPESAMALGRWHGEIEEEIKRLDIPFVMLQPAYFYQNLLGLAPLILRGVLPGPMGTARFAMVDARDVAAAAAEVLTKPDHDGKTYVLTGPAALSYAEAAATLSKALGRPVAYSDTPPAAAREHMITGGYPEWRADALLELAAALRSGKADLDTDAVKTLTGRAPIAFESFVRSYKSSFG